MEAFFAFMSGVLTTIITMIVIIVSLVFGFVKLPERTIEERQESEKPELVENETKPIVEDKPQELKEDVIKEISDQPLEEKKVVLPNLVSEGSDKNIGKDKMMDDLFQQFYGKNTTYRPAGGGGYALLKNSLKEKSSNRASIPYFSFSLQGKTYEEANEIAKENGYTLHVLYNGLSQKMPLPSFSENVIGVRIKDPNFKNKPSNLAVVTEIIDLGGIDSEDLGAIKL